jgi:Tol biopolymer transport system component
MNKRAIAILGAIFLLIVGTLGFLIYSKYGGKKTTLTPVINTGNSASSTPIANNPATTTPPQTKFVKLLDDQVVSPALFFNGKGITFFDTQGQLYQAGFVDNSNPLAISSKQSLDIEARAGITKILWPPKGDNFIAQFVSSSGQPTWSFYDSAVRTYTDLPGQVESVDWLPTGDKIVYIWLDNGKATLNISDPDTKNYQTTATMWEPDDQVDVSPDGKNILYFEQNAATTTNPIFLTTPDGKIWKTLVNSGFNYGVLWSPDSQKFLFGKRDSSGQNFQLWYYNLLTGEVTNLKLNTTPDKAVWSQDSQTIYAAVSQTGAAGGGNLTSDTFFRLDTSTMDKQQYDSGTVVIDGRSLFLGSNGDKLFFKNAQDGGLYYLDLTQ